MLRAWEETTAKIRIIIPLFHADVEIHIITWDLCLNHCYAYVSFQEKWQNNLFTVISQGFFKALSYLSIPWFEGLSICKANL